MNQTRPPQTSMMQRFVWAAAAVLAPGLVLGGLSAQDADPTPPRRATVPEDAPQRPEEPVGAPTRMVAVPLPLTGTDDARIKQALRRAVEDLAREATERNTTDRPVLVLHFTAEGDDGGAATEFERAFGLARYLTGAEFRRVRVVAWLTGPVRGHSVLPVIACEELIVSPEASLGEAGVLESQRDPVVIESYRSLAGRRNLIPALVAEGMVDPAAEILRVTEGGRTTFLTGEQARERQQAGTVESVETVAAAGEMVRLTGTALRRTYRFASHLASSPPELATALGVPVESLRAGRGPSGTMTPVMIPLEGPIHTRSVGWIERAMTERLRTDEAFLVFVTIDSAGGDPRVSLGLARFLADLDPTQVRTVAFVRGEALADASIIAAACDEIVMSDRGVLGGPGAYQMSGSELDQAGLTVRQIAERKGRDGGLLVGLIDGRQDVAKYTHRTTGQSRYMTEIEYASLPDAELWQPGGTVNLRSGLRLDAARSVGLVSRSAETLDQVAAQYQVTEPVQDLRPNWAHSWIEQAGRVLSNPWVSRTLLFVAFLALLSELSSPGLGVPGFISAVCFLLFFWAQFLNGTAGWLEILLFVAGLTFIAVELFVMPGVGVFGVGGGAMVILSVVLASQTFVIPRNAYQWEQLPWSLSAILIAGVAVVVAMTVVRHFLPKTPYVRNIILAPPEGDDLKEIQRRESLADYADLLGQTGQTTSRLVPAGKARIGGRVISVLSDGPMIDTGTPIRVIDVVGAKVIVEQADNVS